MTFGLKSNQQDYIFVPYSLQGEGSAVYAQLLGIESDYMQSHHNIALAGITDALMMRPHHHGEELMSFIAFFKEQPGGIYQVDPTCCLLDLGKWNISTDSQHYQELKEWIKCAMPPFYENLPTTGCFTYFHTPKHVGRALARTYNANKSQPTPHAAYSVWLCKTFGKTETAPTAQSVHQAWQLPPVNIDYSFKNAVDFPALGTKIEETKSTALSTQLMELAQFKEEAAASSLELSQLKLDISQMMHDIISAELPSIVA
jgi:hypothetical protein